MNIKNVKRCTGAVALSLLFVLPQWPHRVFAAGSVQPKTMDDVGLPADLFPIDRVVNNKVVDDSGDGTTADGQEQQQNTSTKTPSTKPRTANTANTDTGNHGPTTFQPHTIGSGAIDMQVAKVPDEYSCPLFDNRPHAELLQAIDALTKQVQASPDCKDDTAASTVDSNTKTIRDSVTAIEKMTQVSDPSQVSIPQIETAVSNAIAATQNLGNVLGNNSFLNSKCGRQTMSSGRALLALNDIVNGISPYALMAVSLNAALLPALPYVIGGIAVTSGISIAEKMYNANTLDMSQPEHRKALLQNTCQFVKVAKKVRFMELAQSGQIEQITQELDKNIQSYKARFSQPSRELYSLLKLKDSSDKQLAANQTQLLRDRSDLAALQDQISQNNDDLMVCTLSRELVNWAQDGQSFPASALNNLAAVSSSVHDNAKFQVLALQSLNKTSMQRVVAYADRSATDDGALKSCAQAGRSWVAGIQQAVTLTGNLIDNERGAVDAELSQNADYRQWKSQYNMIKIEQLTVTRVEKALETLAQDNSIIDRSELAQRMSTLKVGLFGSRGMRMPVISGAPPVVAWLNYTKNMHDRALSDFLNGWNKLHEGSLTFTTTGKNPFLYLGLMGVGGAQMPTQVSQVTRNLAIADKLANLTLQTLPLGSRQNEIACQELESTWLSWSAAVDHLGATQLFCNMIDGVLDVNMDNRVMTFCRGNVDLNGTVNSQSVVGYAKYLLVNKGYQAKANIVSAKLKELQCPMPSISVMNN